MLRGSPNRLTYSVGRIVQEEPENHDEEYHSLREQQKKLDEDRRRFAEASARLDHQRQTLQVSICAAQKALV